LSSKIFPNEYSYYSMIELNRQQNTFLVFTSLNFDPKLGRKINKILMPFLTNVPLDGTSSTKL
jgi:hypothetical protein